MISGLKLRNWRSHEDTQLKFSKGSHLILGPMGSGKSLCGRETVLVNLDGWRKVPIGTLVDEVLGLAPEVLSWQDHEATRDNPFGASVLSLNPKTLRFEERPITGFLRHTAPKRLLCLRTRGGREVTITRDHSLVVIREGKAEAIRGEAISVGMHVPVAKNLPLGSCSSLIDVESYLPDFRSTTPILEGLTLVSEGFSVREAAYESSVPKGILENWNRRGKTAPAGYMISRNTSNGIPEFLDFSTPSARLFGAFVAEGHADDAGVQITNSDPVFARIIEEDWEKVFPNIPCRWNDISLCAHGKAPAAFFGRAFGNNSGGKRIPAFLYSAPIEQVAGFLSAYFEGDGWIVCENAIELGCASKSRQLLDGIQTLLARFGINSSIRTKHVKGAQYFSLTVSPKHIPTFAECIDFLCPAKKERLSIASRKILTRSRWDGIDIIPDCDKSLRALVHDYHLGKRSNPLGRKISRMLYTYATKENIGRETLLRILSRINAQADFKSESFLRLERLATGDVFFDEIISIGEIESKEPFVYDLQIDQFENFIAGTGNWVVHNSSIFDAITFALFGTWPALKSRRVALEETIMQRPNKASAAKIELSFDKNGKNYAIERIVTNKGSEAFLREDGRLLDGPQAIRTNESIYKLLKTDYETFVRTVYSEQNRLDYFLNLQPRERKKQIDELLGIDRFEAARAGCTQAINKLKTQRSELESFLQGAGILEARMEIERLIEELEEAKLKTQKTQNETLAARQQRDTENKKLQELERLEKESREVEKQVAMLENQKEWLQNSITSLETQLSQAPRKEQAEAALKRAHDALSEKENAHEQSQNSLSKLVAGASETEKAIATLQKEIADCPVCDSQLTEQKRSDLLQQKTSALAKQKSEIEERQKQLASAQKEIADSRKSVMEAQIFVAKAEQGEKTRAEIEKGKQKLQATITQLENLRQTLASRDSQAAAKLENELRDARESLRNSDKALANAEAESRHAAMLQQEKNNALERLKTRIVAIEKRAAEAKEIERKQEALQKFHSLLGETQAELRAELVDAVNEALASVFPAVYPYGDFRAVRLEASEEDYAIQLQSRDNTWLAIEGASGGEKSCAALALRIAFASVLSPGLSLLVLDEPTHNLDARAVELLSAALRDELPKLVEQTFIITHDDNLKESASTTIFRVERDKERGEKSMVEALEVVSTE
ncbi:MAG TPA: LAGLIDADG family homing endonuclease [Candidatus Norongarragalinales archaeon]|jgi:DNA repair exonuclease SbcCD ATPase subunit/intein/homing endonuclease|nr:LAGLIDADG family homing endonuclease [Candidatus Norongarragalinales archaeon]